MADGWLQGFVLDGNSETFCRGRGGQEGEGCMRTKLEQWQKILPSSQVELGPRAELPSKIS